MRRSRRDERKEDREDGCCEEKERAEGDRDERERPHPAARRRGSRTLEE
jgi:hypothetical protein